MAQFTDAQIREYITQNLNNPALPGQIQQAVSTGLLSLADISRASGGTVNEQQVAQFAGMPATTAPPFSMPERGYYDEGMGFNPTEEGATTWRGGFEGGRVTLPNGQSGQLLNPGSGVEGQDLFSFTGADGRNMIVPIDRNGNYIGTPQEHVQRGGGASEWLPWAGLAAFTGGTAAGYIGAGGAGGGLSTLAEAMPPMADPGVAEFLQAPPFSAPPPVIPPIDDPGLADFAQAPPAGATPPTVPYVPPPGSANEVMTLPDGTPDTGNYPGHSTLPVVVPGNPGGSPVVSPPVPNPQSFLNPDGSFDWEKFLAAFGPAALGAYASNEQTRNLREIADRQWGAGEPSRGRYEASFAPGFTMANDPGYTDMLNQGAESVLSNLSRGGNPYGNPSARTAAIETVSRNLAYPALQGYRTTNMAGGGLASIAAGAPAASTTAAGSEANAWNALGSGLSTYLNPPQRLTRYNPQTGEFTYGRI